MKQKLLLSKLDMKKLRDRVQHLQNELIRVSWGLWGQGEGTMVGSIWVRRVWEEKGEQAQREWRQRRKGTSPVEDSAEAPRWTVRAKVDSQAPILSPSLLPHLTEE